MQEFVNITYWDVMQGLEIEKSEASHPGVTIFSQVLASLVNEPKVMEDLPHLDSPPPKDEAIWYASPSQGLEQSDRYLIAVTSLVNWLDLGVGGDNIRESQGGRSIFQNPQMSTVFPPPWEVMHYEGATLTELDQ